MANLALKKRQKAWRKLNQAGRQVQRQRQFVRLCAQYHRQQELGQCLLLNCVSLQIKVALEYLQPKGSGRAIGVTANRTMRTKVIVAVCALVGSAELGAFAIVFRNRGS